MFWKKSTNEDTLTDDDVDRLTGQFRAGFALANTVLVGSQPNSTPQQRDDALLADLLLDLSCED